MKFTIRGKPQAWQRVKIGRYGQTYDPNVKVKRAIGFIALEAMSKIRNDLKEANLMICTTFYIADKRKRDLDNLVKNVCDALNEVVYKDDSQIVRLLAAKEPCEKHEERTEVEIFPI